MKKVMPILAAALAMGGGLPEIKLSAKDKRSMNDRRPNKPPRSMTEAEKEYYRKHKHLNGFVEPLTETT